jgi:hypothetical protein
VSGADQGEPVAARDAARVSRAPGTRR